MAKLKDTTVYGDLDIRGGAKLAGFPMVSVNMFGVGVAIDLSTVDLDTVKGHGIYKQRSHTNATLARHYPRASAAGIMVVYVAGTDASSAGITQIFYQYGPLGEVWRRWSAGVGAWSAWVMFYHTGNLPAGSPSDRRIKDDIRTIMGSLDKVDALSGVTYLRKGQVAREAGVIAQELLEVLPEAVLGGPTLDDPDATYSVNYGSITSLLIEAIKELRAEVETLKSKCRCDV